ncbi:MAG: sensor domain-containing diguanylate cyclase [Planctomycetota bacterium]|jgi:diguanylate cyclase (GGDEF)-like protein/PAS domain S-box-containing protein
MEQDTATIQPNLLRMHFENSVDGQYVLDPEADVFIKVNPAMCKLLGYTAEQLVEARRPIATKSIIHPDDREMVRDQRKGAHDEGENGVSRFRIVRSDGEQRHLEVQFTLIKYMGRLLQVGSARDVSEQVKLEIKLRHESDFNRQLTLSAQNSAKDAQRKSLEVLEANTRVGALSEVLGAIPVLTKRVLEIDTINDVFKETALTMTNEAQFASCSILLRNSDDELEIKYANPFRQTTNLNQDSNPHYQKIMVGEEQLIVDDQGNHIAPIRAGSEVRGIMQVGLPKNLQRFYRGHKPIQQSIKDLVSTIADFLGVVVVNHENLERIKRQSRMDKMTGLYNRRVFEEQLATEFRRALRYERDLSLMFIDIDHFKHVNDNYGHQHGDKVLGIIGEILGGSFRDLDTVCRYGGEELVAILPETVGEAAHTKAEQIRRKVQELKIPWDDKPGETMGVTISVGIANITKGTSNEQQLLRDADRAVYYCKEHGRNQVHLISE